MFKILILFKKLKIKQIQVKSRVLRVLYAGKIHDYVVKVMYVYRVRVCDTRTRLKYTDFFEFQCMLILYPHAHIRASMPIDLSSLSQLSNQ